MKILMSLICSIAGFYVVGFAFHSASIELEWYELVTCILGATMGVGMIFGPIFYAMFQD